jgi:hypothetical protein
MTDNVILPGTGETVATDDVGGVQFQRVKLDIGDNGASSPVTATNALPVDASYGELVGALEALRMATNSLTKSIGFALPNLLGQPIFEARQATAGNLNATVSGTLSTVTTVSAVTNQSQIGGFNANDQIPSFLSIAAASLRRNITVT